MSVQQTLKDENLQVCKTTSKKKSCMSVQQTLKDEELYVSTGIIKEEELYANITSI